MLASVDGVKRALRKMGPEQRDQIRQFLLEGPDSTKSGEEDDAATAAELNRRIAAIERGEVIGIPARQFLDELSAEHP